MGILASHVKWLVLMKDKYSLNFDTVAMLGRQTLQVAADEGNLEKLIKTEEISQEDGYSEQLWKALNNNKVNVVRSFDFSRYENATDIYDLNEPIPAELYNNFSIVYDGGTLEHVFDYPQGLRNAMDMVKEGGCLVLATPANNDCGHGFYQFSPELFFSVLTPRNGFEIKDITAIVQRKELSGRLNTKYYKLKDNTKTGERLCLKTKQRTYLLVLAKKISSEQDGKPLAIQQSYYVSSWENGAKTYKRGRLVQFIKKHRCLYRTCVNLYGRVKDNVRINKFVVEYNIEREISLARGKK